jgi:hypothetical protein
MGLKAGVTSAEEYRLLQDAEAARNEIVAVDVPQTLAACTDPTPELARMTDRFTGSRHDPD